MTAHHVQSEVHDSIPPSINIEPGVLSWVYTTLTIVIYINYKILSLIVEILYLDMLYMIPALPLSTTEGLSIGE